MGGSGCGWCGEVCVGMDLGEDVVWVGEGVWVWVGEGVSGVGGCAHTRLFGSMAVLCT